MELLSIYVLLEYVLRISFNPRHTLRKYKSELQRSFYCTIMLSHTHTYQIRNWLHCLATSEQIYTNNKRDASKNLQLYYLRNRNSSLLNSVFILNSVSLSETRNITLLFVFFLCSFVSFYFQHLFFNWHLIGRFFLHLMVIMLGGHQIRKWPSRYVY